MGTTRRRSGILGSVDALGVPVAGGRSSANARAGEPGLAVAEEGRHEDAPVHPNGGEQLSRICREAEAAGAGALWAIDHLFWGGPVLECLATLAVAATSTSRVPIGSCVLQLPLRSPPAVAKQAATIQYLSGGRFVLGVGVGSHPGEFEAAGVEFTEHGGAMDAGIAAVRAAWATGWDEDLTYCQRPAPIPVPIWIGGSSPAARRRAARWGTGGSPSSSPLSATDTSWGCFAVRPRRPAAIPAM